MTRAQRLPFTVIVVGAVSLLTDVSSEMIYPLLPQFLAGTLGAAAWTVGLVEGLAETTAAAVKILAGALTDRSGKRKPLMLLGYGLAGLVRPLIGLSTSWAMVLALRVTDRIGKGLRGAPRDALIADVTPAHQRGAAYGLHRAMDHLGAVIGPLVAALLLRQGGLDVRDVFLLAGVPAALVMVLLVVGVREPAVPPPRSAQRPKLAWRTLPPGLRRMVVAIGLFTLGNSTDAFLLLALTDAGLPLAWVAAAWSAHHVVKVVSTALFGRLSDRLGRKGLVLAGWALYAAVYLGLAVVDSLQATVALFLAYGVYFGLTEPVEKAWVADLAPPEQRGVAFGVWQAVVALGALPASLAFGLVWNRWGEAAAFTLGATLAALGAVVLVGVPARGEARPA